ncbi:MAG: tetratricopeptide repeat protein [Carboxylicivirga sp.]|jgi:tetratricopeptide (TPR) repeat protein|nr:tetratricopeptide repeat protein [Carboxylicivirga sp.]
MKLNNSIYDQILHFSDSGDKLIEQGKYAEAIIAYQNALNLLPTPKENWDASTWILSAIGDAYYLNEQFDDSLNFFFDALNCPNGINNGFINLRIGQLLFEINKIINAEKYLLKAYMFEGSEIFDDEDVKYYKQIQKYI